MKIDPNGMEYIDLQGLGNAISRLASSVWSKISGSKGSSGGSSGGGDTVRFRNREYKSGDLEVHAIRSGTVVEAKSRKGYGPQVLVASDESKGKSGDRYAHLNPQMAAQGSHVNAGDVIGTVAATDPLPGRNTGPHLHHEVIPDLANPGSTVKPDSGDAKKALPSSEGRSSGYGERKDPLDPSKTQFHKGEDIRPPYKEKKR
jgi:murein DD-endopeptidase MepM/ murein hydrolase activator NlpD